MTGFKTGSFFSLSFGYLAIHRLKVKSVKYIHLSHEHWNLILFTCFLKSNSLLKNFCRLFIQVSMTLKNSFIWLRKNLIITWVFELLSQGQIVQGLVHHARSGLNHLVSTTLSQGNNSSLTTVFMWAFLGWGTYSASFHLSPFGHFALNFLYISNLIMFSYR
jgi:hypothetical protein